MMRRGVELVWCRSGARAGSLALLALSLVGCIFDPDDRCGKNQEYAGGLTCRCIEGYVLGDDRSTCVEEVDAGAPAGCNSDADCSAPTDHCASDEGMGYCTTSGCSSSRDCDLDWYCARDGSDSYCHAPPTGLGERCESDADCEDYAARLCDTVQSNTCQLIDCSTASPCPNGYVCCDLSKTGFFDGTICMQGDACLAGERIE